jgi:hypothetical protein
MMARARKRTRIKASETQKDAQVSVPASHDGIPPSNPEVKPEPLAALEIQGVKSLETLNRPLPTGDESRALTKLPDNVVIKGERTAYGICGGKVYDVAKGENMPMISGAMVHHVPMNRKEIIRVLLKGWDKAAKHVEDIANAATDPATKATNVNSLLGRCTQVLPTGTSMREHTQFAYEMGYKMGIRFELLKYPDIMVHVPFGDVQGNQAPYRDDVKTEIERSQQPMPL